MKSFRDYFCSDPKPKTFPDSLPFFAPVAGYVQQKTIYVVFHRRRRRHHHHYPRPTTEVRRTFMVWEHAESKTSDYTSAYHEHHSKLRPREVLEDDANLEE